MLDEWLILIFPYGDVVLGILSKLSVMSDNGYLCEK